MPVESFFSATRPAVYAACVLKLAITIAVCVDKASQTSLIGLLELASSILTDWMLTIFAARALLQYVGVQAAHPRRSNRMHTSISSNFSTITRASIQSDVSTRSLGSTLTNSSGITHNSIESTTTSVIDRRTRISLPMRQFLLARDYSFEATLGTLEGNLDAFGGPPVFAG